MAHFTGSKYESVKNLSRVQIAKLVRQDIKSAIAKHELPVIKFSLRVTGHNALVLHVTEMSDGILLYNPEYLEAEYVTKDTNWIYRNREPGRYTTRAAHILSTIQNIMDAYNFDKSDIQTDYFHVNFYTTVSFCHELTEARLKSEMEPAIFARNLKIVRDQREATFVKREQERLAQQVAERMELQAIQDRQEAAQNNTQVLRTLGIVQPRETISQAAERVRLEAEREEALIANRPRVELTTNLQTWRSRQTINSQRQRMASTALLFTCLACNSSGRDVNHRVCTYCAGDRETTNSQNQRFIDAKIAELAAMAPLRSIPDRPAQYAAMNGASSQRLSNLIQEGPVTLSVPLSTVRPIGTPIAQPAPKSEDSSDPSDEPHAYMAARFANLEID